MDLQFLCDFAEPVVIAICLCIGYVIKSSLDFIPNKYIPLIMAVLGVITNILIKKGYSPVDVHVKKKNRKQILKTLKQDNNIEDLDATIFSPKMDEFFDKYFETLWDFE